jgi:hypothetical protein
MNPQRPSLLWLFLLPFVALTSVALVCRVQAAQSTTPPSRPAQAVQSDKVTDKDKEKKTDSSAAGAGERFSATAVNMAATGSGPVTTPISIVISRWSTDAERDALVNALQEKGPDAVLDKLKDMPRAGSIAGPGSVGQEVHFARRIPGPGNSERVVLITDRPMSLWEMRSGARTVEYPFTLVELHVGPNGKGEGKASVATKVIFDKDAKSVVLENWDNQPVALQNVTRDK